ncbi:MAG: hypothetical protein NTZ98_10780 [Acidobacteria bacterium]|jgi:hypothetical protein|nr:hypothetical protein [Acidobacteriota bacterium]
MDGDTQIIRWRPGRTAVETFFPLRDLELRESPARVHDIAVDANHQLYLGENDNHFRSSYLWTATLPE